MYDWQDFNTAFHSKPNFSPDSKQVEAAQRHRKELGGLLFFDRIWISLGLKQPSKSYPPKSNQDLRTVWARIVQAPAADEQKLALLYYLIRDCRFNDAEEVFARRACLPDKYQLLVTGLWELDHCHFSRALEHLTDPSLTPTFADDILYTLLQHPKCDRSLAMAYYITVNPPLQNQNTLDAYFQLLAQSTVTEAYYFAKAHPRHKQLFEELITSLQDAHASPDRASRAVLFVGLPFSDEEETWFEDCLLHGAASKSQHAKDTLMMRKIATGKLPRQQIVLDRFGGSTIDGLDWDDFRDVMTA